MIQTKPLKDKKCKNAECKRLFSPARPMQSVCSPTCGLKIARATREKKERVETAAKRKALRPRKEWMDLAQAAVNRYVRLRDAHLPCVSCDRPATWDGRWNASHFRSVGAATAVRYHLWNIHRACYICNMQLSGNLSEYEPRLRARIGDAKVDWLRTQNQRVLYDIEYLQRIRKVFAKKANRLEKRMERQ